MMKKKMIMRAIKWAFFVVAAIFFADAPISLLGAEADEASVNIKADDETTIKKNDNGNHGDGSSYGLDVSFPIQRKVSTNYAWLPHNTDPTVFPVPAQYQDQPVQPLGDRHAAYMRHLNGCRAAYNNNGSSDCDRYEYERQLMNRRQPASMKNYTKAGFQKIRAPDAVFQAVSDFWKKNHYKGQKENWGEGSSYLNHWEAPSYLVSVDDSSLRGSGPKLKEEIWAAASATLEEWMEQELQPCSLYGIRVYGPGSVMMPHVDYVPLVASAMMMVAQDVDEPWPFEMYHHETGLAHNITLEPGEMLLFESHSVIHGHPFPLVGSFVAMVFMHFEPTGRALYRDAAGSLHYNDEVDKKEAAADNSGKDIRHRGSGRGSGSTSSRDDVDKQYRKSVKDRVGGQSSASDGRLPPYIKRESPEEENWRRMHPDGWSPPYETLPKHAHAVAKSGELEQLKQVLAGENEETVLTERDEKGWQILHQGVSSGSKDVVELLVNSGAEINSRTHGGYGETPLRIAEKIFGDNERHPVVQYLKSLGALSLGPEL